eukprot:403342494
MNPLANHDVNQLPIRAYLESNLMPLLLEALNELAKHKPQDPIEFIANYMLEHNPENR